MELGQGLSVLLMFKSGTSGGCPVPPGQVCFQSWKFNHMKQLSQRVPYSAETVQGPLFIQSWT